VALGDRDELRWNGQRLEPTWYDQPVGPDFPSYEVELPASTIEPSGSLGLHRQDRLLAEALLVVPLLDVGAPPLRSGMAGVVTWTPMAEALTALVVAGSCIETLDEPRSQADTGSRELLLFASDTGCDVEIVVQRWHTSTTAGETAGSLELTQRGVAITTIQP
jgi:hypothetical protein